MLAIVFALGGVMPYPWLVAIFAALGEVVGAMTIYATGRGAGHAISQSKHTRVQKYYDKLLNLIRKRGTITLLIVTSIVNPFFYPAAFAAGALKFGLKKYIPIVLVGKLIKSFTVVYAGYFGLKGIFHAIGIEI
jgi:membrane protein DedA with SNARE-associated domain